MENFKIMFAPVQGHTDAAYRNMHARMCGGADIYFTPFIRIEKGSARKRDLTDLYASLSEGNHTVAQVIFKNTDELKCLLDTLVSDGVGEIDLNMGCPFPLQTARGRGAATIGNRTLAEDVAKLLPDYPDVKFSMKIRLGMENGQEWKESLEAVNSMPLRWLTVHPRFARQQYGGTPDLDAFSEIAGATVHPLVYNGDLLTPADIDSIRDRFPSLHGVMIGRGLLGRPSLAREYSSGTELPKDQRVAEMKAFHDALFEGYSSVLCGDAQILCKIKPFWEYAENEIGRKPWKAIRKASTMPKYLTALAGIE